VAGWLLFRGNAWGLLLGVTSGIYWLWDVARVLQVSGGEWHPEAWIYLGIGWVVLAGLLMPGSVRWFRSAWRASTGPVALG